MKRQLGVAKHFVRADMAALMTAATATLADTAGSSDHAKVQLWEGGPYWATTNIGAEEPWDYGLYFWWGDTVGYRRENDAWVASDGSSQNFSFEEGNTPTYGKDSATLLGEGWITADGVLAPEHDAAQTHWGGNWRMPTDAELSDLCANCNWTWTTTNGVNGYVVSGRGDYASASIFLPAAGCGVGTFLRDAGSLGNFWSSVPYPSGSYYARYLDFLSIFFEMGYGTRCRGRPVRPVQGVTTRGTFPPDGKYRETVDGIEYMFTITNGEATIANWEEAWSPAIHDGTEGELEIPSVLGGCPVTSIGGCAFSSTRLTSVTIPDGVTDIGHSAFYYADLTSVAIPDSVKRIGSNAFDGCPMTSIRIPYALQDEYSTWGLSDDCEIVIGAKLPLAIATDATLPVALTGGDYWQQLEASGGKAPYTWEIVDQDNWPSWLSSDGINYRDDLGYLSPHLEGWPSEDDIGTHTFTLRLTDAEGTSVEKTFTLEVVENPNHRPVIGDATPYGEFVTVRVGEPVSFSATIFDPDGDEVDVSWWLYDISWESLAQLETNNTGCVEVTLAEGSYYVEVSASDGQFTEYRSWCLRVLPADAILIDQNLPHAVEGTPYSMQLTATGGTAPYTWSADESWDGYLSEEGVLEVWTDGFYFGDSNFVTTEFTVTVSDAEGRSMTQTITVIIEAAPNKRPVIDSQTPASDEWEHRVSVGQEQTFSVEAHDPEGEALAFIWELDGEQLENVADNWSWTPGGCDVGKHSLEVRCSDGERESFFWSWDFTVVTTNVLSADISLPTAVVGTPYSASFTVSGGTEPYVWGASEYALSREANSFAETGVAQDWDEDDGCWRVDLPFSFPFYGTEHDEIWVSDNGTICLDGVFSQFFFDEDDFKAHSMIAPLWADMDGSLQTVFLDDFSEDAITVRWLTHYWDDGYGDPVEFAATLCEDGMIQFAYGDEATSGAVGISAGDGVRFELPDALQNTTLGGRQDVVFRPAALAPGFALSPEGIVSGTPKDAGTYRFPVTVADAEGATWSGEAVLHVVEAGAAVTLATPVPVEHSWLDGKASAILAAHDGDYEAAALATAANGWPVWECYVAGIDPENEAARFEATIEIVDGKPVVKWNPPLSEEETAKRTYRVLGKRTLGDPDEDWMEVPEGDEANYNFFKVSVEMK